MPNPTPVSSPAGGATRESVRDVVTVAWKLFQDQDCTCQAEDAGWCWYHLSDEERLERIIALVEMRFPSVAATPASPPREETTGECTFCYTDVRLEETGSLLRVTPNCYCGGTIQLERRPLSASPTPNGEAER